MKNRKQITFFFRNPGKGKYSIESVFESLIRELEVEYDVRRIATNRSVDFVVAFRCLFLRSDVFHITGAVNYLALFLPRKKTVLTVHDIGHYTITLKGWRKFLLGQLFWRWPLSRLKFVAAISAFTRNHLHDCFGIQPGRIRVIPNPVSREFVFKPRTRKQVPVILQLGSSPNKNVGVLLTAVEGLEVKVLLIRPFDEFIAERLRSGGVDFEFREHLPVSELVNAYHESDIVYFASTFEGFGLPIIEGMATGRPVVTSDLAPMNDFPEGSVVLVDPNSPAEVRSAILRLLQDENHYNSVQSRGLEVVSSFSPAKIAGMYRALYQEIDGE